MKKIILITLLVVMTVGLLVADTVIATVEGEETVEVTLTPGIYHYEVEGIVDIFEVWVNYWCLGDLDPDVNYEWSGYMGGSIGLWPVNWTSDPFKIGETTTCTFSAYINDWDACETIESTGKLVRTAKIDHH